MRPEEYLKWGQDSISNEARTVPQMRPGQHLKWGQDCLKWGQESTLRGHITSNKARRVPCEATTVPQIRPGEYLTWSGEHLTWPGEYLTWPEEYLTWTGEYLRGQDSTSNDARALFQMRSGQYLKLGQDSTSNKARIVPYEARTVPQMRPGNT